MVETCKLCYPPKQVEDLGKHFIDTHYKEIERRSREIEDRIDRLEGVLARHLHVMEAH